MLSDARFADMDVESFAEGILGAIVVNEGERANVGASIAFIAESEADLAEAKKKGGSGGAAAPAGACLYCYVPASRQYSQHDTQDCSLEV
jgi:pyruvate dehydrogenase E2 component (dihydrolipoamide acetyltransferase)